MNPSKLFELILVESRTKFKDKKNEDSNIGSKADNPMIVKEKANMLHNKRGGKKLF